MDRLLKLLAQLLLVVAVAVSLAVAGAPVVGVAVAASFVGTALVMRHVAATRYAGAEEVDPGRLERAAVSIPVERVAVGGVMQTRFLPPAREVWAPGVLGVSTGHVDFVPSRSRLADRAWSAAVEEAEVKRVHGRACVIRLHGPDGSAQFIAQIPAREVSEALDTYVGRVGA